MRPLRRTLAACAVIATAALGVAARAQTNISSVAPTTVPAGSPGVTLTFSGTLLPAFSAGGSGVCFYTGFGSTAALIPTGSGPYTVVVPASPIQSVPPGQFAGGPFNASFYVASATLPCTGTGAGSNIVTVPIVLPTVSSFAAASVPQKNPVTGVQPVPYAIHFAGSNFISTMTAAYTWTSGSGSGAVAYSSIGSVTAKLPTTIPAGVTSTSVTLCNHTTANDYCVAPQTITLSPLTASSGTLTALPNPATALQNVTLTAKFGPAAGSPGPIGAPTGSVAFTNGATSIGSANLVLDKTSALSQSATTTVTAAPTFGMRLIDLNGDGIPDTIFVDGTGKVHVILGTTPIGSFQAEKTYSDPNCGSLNSFDVGDVNNDGYPDLVIDCNNAGGSALADIMLNAGDGSFGAPTTISGVNGGLVALRDMNKDNFTDLIVEGLLATACPGPCPVGFAVFRGNGTGTFTLTTSVPTTSSPGTKLFIADLDGDGYPDILTLNNGSQVTNSIDIYRNSGGTTFGTLSGAVYVPSASVSLVNYPATYTGVFIGDFNGDGLPDLGVIYTSGNGVTTALNTSTAGNISFAPPSTFATPATGISASAGDFTSDGNIDILVATSTAVQVYDGNGKGGFFTNYGSLTATPGGTIASALASDLNGDGDADVVLISSTVGAAGPVNNILGYITSGTASASLATSFSSAGTASLTAAWPGNVSFNNSSGNLSLPVNGNATTTTLTTSGTPTEYGQSVTFTATVSGGAAGVPTGTVNFFDGATNIGSSSLTAGVAGFTTTTLTASTHTISAVYVASAAFATSTSNNVSQVVTQAQAIVSWTPSPATISYGTALSGAQLNATASSKYVPSVAGTFTYTPAAGAVLTAGPQVLNVTFSPADTADFKSATGTTTITVNKFTPTISWSTPAPITYGTPLSATQLNATANGISGIIPGTFVYLPAAGTIMGALSQPLGVSFTPTDTTNYNTTSGGTTITVNKVTPTITWSTPAPISYGTALSATQLNATATGISGALPGTFVYTPAAGTILTAGAGQALSVSFTPTDTADYNNATGGTTITVNKATPTINWSAPSPITYGTPLSATQLNATASGISGALPGTFVYTPAAGTVLSAGAGQALSVTFAPTDTTDYNNAAGGTTITVGKATPAITWPTPSPITYGTALSATQLNATATGISGALPGTFVYTPAAGTMLTAGSQALSVSFTPTDTADYNNATGGTTIAVGKATPTITWPTPSPITYGTALSATQLNATASGISGALPGSFVYTPAAGTVLTAGSQALSVSFTPTDTADYNNATGGTTIAVGKATPTIAWTTPAPITYGTALSATQLNATATGISGALPGTFVYTPAAGTVLTAGSQPLSVSFTPTDTTDYNNAIGGTTISVGKVTPTITWPTPSPIVVGTPLSATQLNATATGISGALPGSFVYTPSAGTVLATGNNQALNVVFTPTDTTDYVTANGSTTLSVIGLVITAVNPASATLGDPNKTITLTGTGFLANSVVNVNGTPIATTFVSATSLTAVIPASYFLTVQTLSLTVFDPTQSQTSPAVNLAVTAPTPVVVFAGPGTSQPAQQPTITFTLTNPYPVVLNATLTLTFAGIGGADDPAIQFATGGRSFTVAIPANTTQTPTIQIQSGTDAGTITLTLALSAGGQNVTPGTVQPVVITIPSVAPTITSATLTRSGNTITVNIIGFSDTRDMTTANFHFVASAGNTINDPDFTVPATALFSTWFTTAGSQVYGSAFTYTQSFNLSSSNSVVGQVAVTLINSAGTSTTVTAQ